MKRTFLSFFLLILLSLPFTTAKAQFFAGVELGTGYQTGYNWEGAYVLPKVHIGGGPFSLLLGYYLVPGPDNDFRQLTQVNEGLVGVRMALPARESKFKFLTQYSFRIGSVTGKDVFINQPSGEISSWTTRYHCLHAGGQLNLPKGFHLGLMGYFGRSNWDGVRNDGVTGANLNIGWDMDI